jgi:hypothetical protein
MVKDFGKAAAVFLLCVFCANPCIAGLVVGLSTLATRVSPALSSSIQDILAIDSNPFQQFHAITFQNSASATQYDMEWAGDEGSFHISANHHLQGMKGFVDSFGMVFVTPAVDSRFSVISEYTYNHPSQFLGSADLSVRATKEGTLDFAFNQAVSGGTFGLHPPAGTLHVDGSGILLAGVTYVLDYQMRSSNYAIPAPTAVWAGDGFIDLTIRPIPEPAALLPLAALLYLAPGRRRSRRSRRAGAATRPSPPYNILNPRP